MNLCTVSVVVYTRTYVCSLWFPELPVASNNPQEKFCLIVYRLNIWAF